MDSNQSPGLGLQAPAPNDVQAVQASALPVPSVGGVMPPLVAPAQGTDSRTNDALEALDQEWIDKAKAIVEQTKGDPFSQSKELNKVRAGYLKARYNKELEVGEDGA
jgi:hypothetical protein